MDANKVYEILKGTNIAIESDSKYSVEEFKEAYSIMLKMVKNIADENYSYNSVYNFPNVLDEECEIYFKGEWIRGKIINDYRFQDGIVTIKTKSGKKIWCPTARRDLYRKVDKDQEYIDELYKVTMHKKFK